MLSLNFAETRSFFEEQIQMAVRASEFERVRFELAEVDHVVHCLTRSCLDPVRADGFWQLSHGRNVQRELWHHLTVGQRPVDCPRLGDQVLVLGGIVVGKRRVTLMPSIPTGSQKQNLTYTADWYAQVSSRFYSVAASSELFAVEDRKVYGRLARNCGQWISVIAQIPEQQMLLRMFE
jgi:hypothetical protein